VCDWGHVCDTSHIVRPSSESTQVGFPLILLSAAAGIISWPASRRRYGWCFAKLRGTGLHPVKCREEGRRDEAAAMTLRLLNRCGGPLSEVNTAQIQSLSMSDWKPSPIP